MAEIDRRKAETRSLLNKTQAWLIVVFVVWMLFEGAIWWRMANFKTVSDPLATIYALKTTGSTALCPGEALTYDMGIRAEGPVVFEIDTSIWRVNPPSILILSQTGRAVLADSYEHILRRRWVVPEQYRDPITGELADWEAGAYERHVAIGTSSRNSEPSVGVLPFSIRKDCP